MIIGNINKTIDTFVEDIKHELQGKDIRIEYLEKQNQKLRDEKYKDNELLRMEAELKAMKEDYYRGFPISEEEQKSIREWMDKHDEEVHRARTLDDKLKLDGCCGGRYTYEFTPTSIGTIGTVKCGCGAKFTFQDI